MKKLILIISILAAPLFANAETDYKITMAGEDFVTQGVEVQPNRNYSRSFDFGRVWVGQWRAADFILEAGRFPVRVYGLNVTGRYFGGNTNCPSLLFPGQRCVIRATYSPNQDGNHYGRINLWVEDDTMTVHLYGQAR